MMEAQGGSFVKALAHCYLMGDPDNRMILKQAFKRYFLIYEERFREHMQVRRLSASLDGLQQGHTLGATNVDQRVPVPAADAQEITPVIIDLGVDSTEHHGQAAGSARPHAAHHSPGGQQ
jgi:hypothetical protein